MSYYIHTFSETRAVEGIIARIELAVSPSGMLFFFNTYMREYLQARAAARFAQEGDDASGPWAPLAESTVMIREALGYGGSGPINRRTGDLMHEVTSSRGLSAVAGDASMYTWPILEGASPETLAAYEGAQFGREGKQPARPVVAVSPTDLVATVKMLSDHVTISALRRGL